MSANNNIDITGNRKISINLSSSGNKSIGLSGGTNDHSKLKKLGFEESGHTGFQKELSVKQLEAIENIKAKEDKSNKISSWDELGDDIGGEVKYPNVYFMMENLSQAETNEANNANAYTDMEVSKVADRVTVNEESIAGAFGAIQNNESNIQGIHDQLVNHENRISTNEDVIGQNVNRIIALENNMGDVETALDNIIAIQNSLIGGDA